MLPAYSGGTAWAFHPLRVAVGHVRPAVLARPQTVSIHRSKIGIVQARIAQAGLADIASKLDAGERLSFEDGVRLFQCPDTLALGWLANRERERRHGARTYYNYNIRLEATNVCVASCLFCSFARLRPGDAGSYTMSLEDAWDKLRQRAGPAADRSPRRQRTASGPAVRATTRSCCAASSASVPRFT